MNLINKILWGCVSTLICAFYNMELKAECKILIESRIEVGNYPSDGQWISVCSESNVCGDNCYGLWGKGVGKGLTTDVLVGSYTEIANSGYYVSNCGTNYGTEDTLFEPSRTDIGLCTEDVVFSSCPTSGLTHVKSYKVNYLTAKTAKLKEINAHHNRICSTINPISGVPYNSTLYMFIIGFSHDCDLTSYDLVSKEQCYIKSGVGFMDNVGSYTFTNSCAWKL